MKIIQFISSATIPVIIVFVVVIGILEKKNVFDIFLKGVIEGQKVVIELFPTLLAILVAVGMLNGSGIIDFISEILQKVFKGTLAYTEIMPLILLRPISGSTSIAIATEIMSRYGVDTDIGLITSVIMGSAETTIYVVSIYTSKLKTKKIRPVIIIGLIGDVICVTCSIIAFKMGIL